MARRYRLSVFLPPHLDRWQGNLFWAKRASRRRFQAEDAKVPEFPYETGISGTGKGPERPERSR